MGQAKARGAYEERVDQAKAAELAHMKERLQKISKSHFATQAEREEAQSILDQWEEQDADGSPE